MSTSEAVPALLPALTPTSPSAPLTSGTPGAAGARRRAALPRRVGGVALRLVLIVGAAAVLLPFVWMVATSFKPQSEIFGDPLRLLPTRWTLDGYREVWSSLPFARMFVNSVVFAGGVTALSVTLDSMAAYALARLRFRGRELCFWLVLATLMVPFQVTLIPLFVTVFELGWLNTYAGLILPRATNAFGIFLLRQFFISIPREIDDAAHIDGASEWRVFWQMILPLSKPALATVAIFHFMYNWNDFLWPLIITSTAEQRTLPAGLTLFTGQFVTDHAVLMAGATISLAPLAIAFLLAQRHFVRGVAMTGLK